MKIATEKLLRELQQLCLQHHQILSELGLLSDEELQAHPAINAWNALECIEHLNRYSRFYLPEIRKRFETSNSPPAKYFRSGWLGNYFAESMKAKPGFKKIKTFRNMNPAGSALDRRVIDEMQGHIEEILHLLAEAKLHNLTRIKTAISISRWLKLRLGDTLRVVIYHNHRHMLQAQRAASLASQAGKTPSVNTYKVSTR